jgi:hypothetical protein
LGAWVTSRVAYLALPRIRTHTDFARSNKNPKFIWIFKIISMSYLEQTFADLLFQQTLW